MKKTYLLLLVLILSESKLFSQINFELIPQIGINEQIATLENSSLDYSDLNGDGFLDIFTIGYSQGGDTLAKKYFNDSLGNFIEVPEITVIGLNPSSTVFADIDNDGDEDLFIIGNDIFGPVSNMYRNDGLGNFIQDINFPTFEMLYPMIVFEDINTDNYVDLIISGTSSGFSNTKIFMNDGNGNFYENVLLPYPYSIANLSSIDYFDVDNDTFRDILLTEQEGLTTNITTKIFKNDGLNNYIELTGQPFDSVIGSNEIADIDNDGDLDIFASGSYVYINLQSTKLYLNDGNGNYTVDLNNSFQLLTSAISTFSDFDGDNDQDLITSGYDINTSTYVTKLYLNDGSGLFSESIENSFSSDYNLQINALDLDNDSDIDLIMTSYGSSKILKNDGSGNFISDTKTPIIKVKQSNVKFADIDSDDDQDLLITGYNPNSTPIFQSKLYKNNGQGNFVEYFDFQLEYQHPNFLFGDVDGDNDVDIVTIGTTISGSSQMQCILWSNDGSGNYTYTTDIFIGSGLNYAKSEFSDIDNDNDLDLLIVGNFANGYSKLYLNDGAGNFSLLPGTPFIATLSGSIDFSDIDGDNDEDVLITGFANSDYSAKLYQNNGGGNFAEVVGTPFTGVWQSSAEFADIDNDNDNDLIVTGQSGSTAIIKIYLNNGLGVFTQLPNPSLTPAYTSSVELSDVDNDNDLDLIVAGYSNSPSPFSKLYLNNGTGIFTEAIGISFEGVGESSIAFSDIDGDQDDDLLITGVNNAEESVANLYKNTVCAVNSIESIIDCSSFTWINGLTYNNSTYVPQFTLTNGAANGCDSIITLNLTIINSSSIVLDNIYSLPSSSISCNGYTIIETSGSPISELSIDNFIQPLQSSNNYFIEDLCPGIHDLKIIDFCDDTLSTQLIIPLDSNFIFSNAFIDSIALDSLGVTVSNCIIYYNGISDAFIDSLWTVGNTVSVIWNIVDINGSSFDTVSYQLNNGNGVYFLQLSVFCPTKSSEDYFTVAQAIYFFNGTVSIASVGKINNNEIINIFPNPVKNNLTIEIPWENGVLFLEDALGRLVIHKDLDKHSTVSLEQIGTGLYYVRIQHGDREYVKKIIKE